jgi:hypothetical protein
VFGQPRTEETLKSVQGAISHGSISRAVPSWRYGFSSASHQKIKSSHRRGSPWILAGKCLGVLVAGEAWVCGVGCWGFLGGDVSTIREEAGGLIAQHVPNPKGGL